MESVRDEVSQLWGWHRLPGRREVGGGWGELGASEEGSDECGSHFGSRFVAVVAILKVKNMLVLVVLKRKTAGFCPVCCAFSRIKQLLGLNSPLVVLSEALSTI